MDGLCCAYSALTPFIGLSLPGPRAGLHPGSALNRAAHQKIALDLTAAFFSLSLPRRLRRGFTTSAL
jgi:hypothetical protein